jgi:hypothetical protein
MPAQDASGVTSTQAASSPPHLQHEAGYDAVDEGPTQRQHASTLAGAQTTEVLYSARQGQGRRRGAGKHYAINSAGEARKGEHTRTRSEGHRVGE